MAKVSVNLPKELVEKEWPQPPLLSIITPTYNRLNLLKETLNSLLTQSCEKAHELIVVDDGSEDGTWEFLENLVKKYRHIRVFKHPENLGVSEARNTGLKNSTGKYIFYLDSDDLLLKGALMEIEKILLEKEPDLLVLNTFREKRNQKLKFKVFPTERDPVKRLKLFLEGAYSEALYVVKRDIAREYTFLPEFKVREDWGIKAKWISLYEPTVINKPFAVIREHPQRLRHISEHYWEALEKSVEFLFEGLPKEFQALKPYAFFCSYFEGAKRAYKAKKYTLTEEYLKRAYEIFPEGKKSFSFLKLRLKLFLKRVV